MNTSSMIRFQKFRLFQEQLEFINFIKLETFFEIGNMFHKINNDIY